MAPVLLSVGLYVVYSVHTLCCACACLLMLVVVLLLRRFDVFHANLRSLLWHPLLCLAVNVGVQMLRPLVPILQQMRGMHQDLGPTELDGCVQFNGLPSPFCAFLSVSGILICMERLYATFNFAKYEHENFEPILAKVFRAMWSILALYCVWELAVDVGPALFSHPYLECQLRLTQVNPLKTHWHTLFALLFHAVFTLVSYVVLTVNREKQEVYVKFYYSALSPRFQIAENLKTVRLLLRMLPQICAALALTLGHSAWLHSREGPETGQLLWTEMGVLIVPLFSLSVALTLIRSSTVFTSKSKLVVRDLWSRLWLTSSLIGEHCCLDCGQQHAKGGLCTDLLREYWDDYLHVQ